MALESCRASLIPFEAATTYVEWSGREVEMPAAVMAALDLAAPAAPGAALPVVPAAGLPGARPADVAPAAGATVTDHSLAGHVWVISDVAARAGFTFGQQVTLGADAIVHGDRGMIVASCGTAVLCSRVRIEEAPYLGDNLNGGATRAGGVD